MLVRVGNIAGRKNQAHVTGGEISSFEDLQLNVRRDKFSSGYVDSYLEVKRRLSYEPEVAAVTVAEQMPDRERLLTRGVGAFFVDGDFSKGEERFKELAKLYPQDVEGRFWEAQVLASEAGDRMGAVRTLRKALKLDPNHALAVAALAGHLKDLNQQEDAEAILRDFRDRNPAPAARRIETIEIPGLTGH